MGELSIKIKIADREYPMKIEASEEERIRKAGKLLNDKIKSYSEQFGIDDKQDLLAMVAFDAQVDKMRAMVDRESVSDSVKQRVSHLNELISKAL